MKRAAAATEAAAAAGEGEEAAEKVEPVEWGRIFTEDDFDRIRCVWLTVHRAYRVVTHHMHSAQDVNWVIISTENRI